MRLAIVLCLICTAVVWAATPGDQVSAGSNGSVQCLSTPTLIPCSPPPGMNSCGISNNGSEAILLGFATPDGGFTLKDAGTVTNIKWGFPLSSGGFINIDVVNRPVAGTGSNNGGPTQPKLYCQGLTGSQTADGGLSDTRYIGVK